MIGLRWKSLNGFTSHGIIEHCALTFTENYENCLVSHSALSMNILRNQNLQVIKYYNTTLNKCCVLFYSR